MTNEELAEWKRLADAATPAPWKGLRAEDSDGDLACIVSNEGEIASITELANNNFRRDAAFIAATRLAVPALIAEYERMRGWMDAVAAHASFSSRLIASAVLLGAPVPVGNPFDAAQEWTLAHYGRGKP